MRSHLSSFRLLVKSARRCNYLKEKKNRFFFKVVICADIYGYEWVPESQKFSFKQAFISEICENGVIHPRIPKCKSLAAILKCIDVSCFVWGVKRKV